MSKKRGQKPGDAEPDKAPVYWLRITLKGSRPPIWRKLAVSSAITLGRLHEVIQIAMGWAGGHLHDFRLREKHKKPGPQEMARLLMQAPGSMDALHRMRGERVFVAKVDHWGGPTEMDGEDEDAVTLGEVCPKVKSRLVYTYDFGDNWEHTLEVQKIVDPEPGANYPFCLAGRKACPPEDCGGIWGYYHLLESIADPDHEDHGELSAWLDREFDPDTFDLEKVNAVLAQWRNRRDA